MSTRLDKDKAAIKYRLQSARAVPSGLGYLSMPRKWSGNWHVDLLEDCLIKVESGKIKRLTISMPPRHGKSMMICQCFTSWFLGRNPDKRIMLCSYSDSLARQWGRKARDLMELYGEPVFGVHVDTESRAANEWNLKGRLGGMETFGVKGSITGKGADVLIIDDPIKNSEEANSVVYRDSVWNLYQSTAYPRLEPGGCVVIVQTRWHEDDLIGRVLADAKRTGEKWTNIRLPAIAELDGRYRKAGEPLWGDRFSKERLEEIRDTVGAFWWASLYQQRPTPMEGGIFKREWLNSYWHMGNGCYSAGGNEYPVDDCWTFATVDLAISQKSTANYTVIAVWASTPDGNLLLLDLKRERIPGYRLVTEIARMTEIYHCHYAAVEKVAFQDLVIQQARMAGMAVRPLRPRGDKVSRAHAASIRFEAGKVFLPQKAGWLEEYKRELLSFPNATHDDQVDATSYACMVSSRTFGAPEKVVDEVLSAYGYGETEDQRSSDMGNMRNEDLMWEF